MAYAAHWQFVMGGDLDGEGNSSFVESWQCAINGTFVVEPTAPDDWLTDTQSDLATWFGSTDGHMSLRARLRFMKLNHIGTDGLFTDPTHPHTLEFTPVVGGNTPVGPGDTCVVWTWTTDLLRGRGSKGRIYPPNVYGYQAAGGNWISTADQTAQLTAARGLLDVLSTERGTSVFVPCVSSGLSAANNQITGIKIGRTIDVQRRRRRQVPEDYLEGAWPA